MPSCTPSARTFTENARRAQIVVAAVATVNEVGYHRTSLAAIAARAGVAKSALVYYFASRDALLLTVVEEVFTGIETVVAPVALAQLHPSTQLRAEVTAGIETVVSQRTADGTPLYLAGGEHSSGVLRDILVSGMDAGVFRRMPVHMAVTLVESLLDVWTTELQRDPDAELGTFGEVTLDFLMNGIAAESST